MDELLVMYDLSMKTSSDRAKYRHFYKWLQKAGFLRMQYSIFYKTVGSFNQGKEYQSIVRNHCNFNKKGYVVTIIINNIEFRNLRIFGNNKLRINTKHNTIKKI